MATIEELEARVAVLEQMLTNGGHIPGNLMQVAPRDPSSPYKVFLGPTEDRGLYIFGQNRFPGQGGEYWAGIETFERVNPANPAWGYGFWPFRFLGTNSRLEANGDLVVQNVVAHRIYLQTPKHMNARTGQAETPARYQDGLPFNAAGEQLGGIMVDTSDLGTSITRVGPDLVVEKNGVSTVIA